jgi:hypothetical protein
LLCVGDNGHCLGPFLKGRWIKGIQASTLRELIYSLA